MAARAAFSAIKAAFLTARLATLEACVMAEAVGTKGTALAESMVMAAGTAPTMTPGEMLLTTEGAWESVVDNMLGDWLTIVVRLGDLLRRPAAGVKSAPHPGFGAATLYYY